MSNAKRLLCGLTAALLVGAFAGCGQGSSSSASTEIASASVTVSSSQAEADNTSGVTHTQYPLTIDIYNADGELVSMTYETAPERVVSTQLSMTELLIELGLEDRIVGVFDNDNALEGETADIIASLPSLGDKKSVSREAILAVEPDIILGKGPLMFADTSIGTVESYQELGISVYTELASASIEQSLENVIEDVRNIGQIFDVQDAADAYAKELQARYDAVTESVSTTERDHIRVLFMAGYQEGSFVAFKSGMSDAMLKVLNAENVLEKGGSGLTLENLIAMSPDYIIYVRADRYAATDGTAVSDLLSNEIISGVPAIANGRIHEVAYDDVMDYGARIFDAVEDLNNYFTTN